MLNHLHLWIIKRGVKDDAPHPLVMFPVRRVVRLLDGLVYVGNGAALDIADVSEGRPPQALGKVALTAPAQDLAVHGDLALVAMGESGLAVVDVSESDEPVVIGTVLETDADVRGVAAGGGYAYLADIALGLRIVDLRDLERPLTAGPHDRVWDGRDDAGHAVPGAAYFLRLETGSRTVSRKLTRVR